MVLNLFCARMHSAILVATVVSDSGGKKRTCPSVPRFVIYLFTFESFQGRGWVEGLNQNVPLCFGLQNVLCPPDVGGGGVVSLVLQTPLRFLRSLVYTCDTKVCEVTRVS